MRVAIAVMMLGTLGCATLPAPDPSSATPSDGVADDRHAPARACVGDPGFDPTCVSRSAWTDYGPIECTPPLPEATPSASPWDAPPEFPAAVVTAAREALAEGPDPRELRFHEVEIWHGTVWDHGARARVFGFVRPATVPGERPFVWVFGEWHAAVAVGPPADLAQQCRAHLAGAGPPPVAWTEPSFRFAQVAGDMRDQSFCPRLLASIELARDEPQLAAQIARTLAAEVAERERVIASATIVEDAAPGEWLLLFGPFERALLAHMQGDDCLALQLLRRYEVGDVRTGDDRHRDDRGTLSTLSALREDQERRSLAPRSVVPEIPEDGPLAEELVPALIASLDEVDALQLSQPGGVYLGGAPQVTGLIRVGRAAIPALIDAIESDARLTRSVQFFRDFAPGREIISVRDVAAYVLEEIAGTSFPIDREVYTLDSPSSWRRFAAHLRAWWEQPGDRDRVERALAMLRDDDLDADAWADAATWLRGTYYAWRGPGEDSGERHRVRRTSGVRHPPHDVAPEEQLGALIMRRAHDALRARAAPEACSLARTAWNADQSVLAGLVTFARQCARVRGCPCLDYLAASLGPSFPPILETLDAYQPNEEEHPLRVLGAAPEHPAVVRLAERVFARAPLVPSRSPGPPPAALVERYFRGRHVAELATLRTLVLRALGDRRAAGRVVVDEDASTESTRDGIPWSRGHVVLADGSRHRVQLRHRRSGLRVRVCDLYADALDRDETFWVDDDETIRDAWIQALGHTLSAPRGHATTP